MREIKLRCSVIDGGRDGLEALVTALRDVGMGADLRSTNAGNVLSVRIPDGLRRSRTRNAGAKRRPLPEGSPLVGMDETMALAWCEREGAQAAAKALGISVSAAYARMRSGRVL